jgi:hypothetical protein
MAPTRLFAHVAPTRTVEGPAALDKEHARLAVVLGEVGPYQLAGRMSDRHGRELAARGLAAVERVQHRLGAAALLAIAIDAAERHETEHALSCHDCKRWGYLYRVGRIRCCRRAREISKDVVRLERAYRRALARIGGS